MKFESIVLLSLASRGLATQSKGLATKPQMGKQFPEDVGASRTDSSIGWNSWNSFKFNINESIILPTAEKLVSTGLLKAGYNYLVLDDGWQSFSRDANGRQQANSTRFPSGIKGLADRVHKMGLKLGVYR